MECPKCKGNIKGNPKFCPDCSKKIKTLEIKEDIGEQIIEKMENHIKILERKAKEEKEKLYPCPFCNKELSLQLLKSKQKEEGAQKVHLFNTH